MNECSTLGGHGLFLRTLDAAAGNSSPFFLGPPEVFFRPTPSCQENGCFTPRSGGVRWSSSSSVNTIWGSSRRASADAVAGFFCPGCEKLSAMACAMKSLRSWAESRWLPIVSEERLRSWPNILWAVFRTIEQEGLLLLRAEQSLEWMDVDKVWSERSDF